MKTQICLLGGELMPNVIGVLHERPDQLFPVATSDSAAQVEPLRRALAVAGSPCLVHDPAEVLPFDLDQCRKGIQEIVSTKGAASINWTGGTKVMSYAAREVAQAQQLPRFYVNTTDREIILEQGDGSVQRPFLDSSALGMNVLVQLSAAGHEVEHGQSLEQFRKHTQPTPSLIDAAGKIAHMTDYQRRALHRLASGKAFEIRDGGMDDGQVAALRAAGLVVESGQKGFIEICSESSPAPFFHLQTARESNATFLKNTFVEVLVWQELRRAAVDDVAWRVRLNPRQKGRISEFDVLAAHEGLLLAIECKSHTPSKESLDDDLYRTIAQSRKLGRLFSKWMLYIHRSREEMLSGMHSSSAEKQLSSTEARARDFGGQIVWFDDLERLHELVSEELKIRKGL